MIVLPATADKIRLTGPAASTSLASHPGFNSCFFPLAVTFSPHPTISQVERPLAESGLKVLENAVDEQVLVAAAQQDPSRFAELYESNFARVYGYIARRVAQRHDAEDLTAEVFHEALRNLPRYEWRGLPFAAWLMGIAANLLADRYRRLARRQTVFDDGNDSANNGEDADRVLLDPATIGARTTDPKIEESAMLSQLVEELPPDQRLVIERRFIEQKSVREIADELRRSEGAIKQLQFRALQNLRARMRGDHVESIPS